MFGWPDAGEDSGSRFQLKSFGGDTSEESVAIG